MSGISRVLVVEDQAMLLLDLVDNLEDHGIAALPVATADTAAQHLPTAQIDALITDIEMPGTMNGLDLAWRFAQQKPGLPIVIVSGGVRPTPAQLPPGAVFVQKPYSIDQVLEGLACQLWAHAA
ncbi:response regulator [Devosia sp. 2618]|uniref:response regulator n=1 Tax=Devosia sp. 2618 TaxID=3156454 RepID=UPI003397F0D9